MFAVFVVFIAGCVAVSWMRFWMALVWQFTYFFVFIFVLCPFGCVSASLARLAGGLLHLFSPACCELMEFWASLGVLVRIPLRFMAFRRMCRHRQQNFISFYKWTADYGLNCGIYTCVYIYHIYSLIFEMKVNMIKTLMIAVGKSRRNQI